MTPFTLIRSIVATCVAVALAPAQEHVIIETKAQGEQARAPHSKEHALHQRLAELIAQLEDDEASTAERKAATEQLVELAKRLSKAARSSGSAPLAGTVIDAGGNVVIGTLARPGKKGDRIDVHVVDEHGEPVEARVLVRDPEGHEVTAETIEVVAQALPDGKFGEVAKGLRGRIVELKALEKGDLAELKAVVEYTRGEPGVFDVHGKDLGKRAEALRARIAEAHPGAVQVEGGVAVLLDPEANSEGLHLYRFQQDPQGKAKKAKKSKKSKKSKQSKQGKKAKKAKKSDSKKLPARSQELRVRFDEARSAYESAQGEIEEAKREIERAKLFLERSKQAKPSSKSKRYRFLPGKDVEVEVDGSAGYFFQNRTKPIKPTKQKKGVFYFDTKGRVSDKPSKGVWLRKAEGDDTFFVEKTNDSTGTWVQKAQGKQGKKTQPKVALRWSTEEPAEEEVVELHVGGHEHAETFPRYVMLHVPQHEGDAKHNAFVVRENEDEDEGEQRGHEGRDGHDDDDDDDDDDDIREMIEELREEMGDLRELMLEIKASLSNGRSSRERRRTANTAFGLRRVRSLREPEAIDETRALPVARRRR